MTLSPQMREVIGLFRQRRLAEPAGAAPSLEQRRASFSPGPSIYPIPPDVTVTPEAAAGVPCYWLTPEGVSAERVMLFLHGGGWMLGSLRSHGELAARLARVSSMRVLFPEYRLAPEHPFPAAVDDVHTVWNWLRATHCGGPASIALVGDSAGGGLALALLTALGAAGEARPGAAALMSPATDLTGSGASMTERVDDDPVFTPDTVRFLESTYLAGADPKLPLASPLFGDLAGLPPPSSRSARPKCCSVIPSGSPTPARTSPCTLGRGCRMCTKGWQKHRKPSRPPIRSGRSCELTSLSPPPTGRWRRVGCPRTTGGGDRAHRAQRRPRNHGTSCAIRPLREPRRPLHR